MIHYTTIEQSKKLVELGLNPESADMHYPDYYFDGNAKGPCNTPYKEAIEDLFHVYINPKTKRLLPCWSLGALINLMPSTIYKDGENITLTIDKNVVYHYFVCYTSHYHLDEIWFSKENLLDSVFEMVCWLLENGYIKKGE